MDLQKQLALRQAIMGQEPQLPVAETPEQFLARMQAWQLPGQLTAMDRGVLSAGTALMQPIPVGQTAAGHVGTALSGGVNAYDTTQRANVGQALTLETARLRGREAEGTERERAERLAASRGTRATAEARAPIDIATAWGNYKKVEAELRQIEAEEQEGGPRTPEMIKRRAAAEARLREELANMYRAHATTYRAQAERAQQPRQTLNVQDDTLPDGRKRITEIILINGKRFMQSTILPLYDSYEAAYKAEKAAAEKKAGWFGSVNEAEVQARAKAMSTPQTTFADQANKPVTEADLIAAETPTGGMPAAFPHETGAQLSASLTEALRRKQTELANEPDPAKKASIRQEIENMRKRGTPSGTGSAQRPVQTPQRSTGATPPASIPKTPTPVDLKAAKAARERAAAQAAPATPTYSNQKVGPLSPNWLLAEEAAKGNAEAQRILDARRAGLGTFTSGNEPLE